MPRYFLRTLSIEGFRGINNQGAPLVLRFDPNKVTSVFGENGMGKSSVFEAVEYAIFGKVSRLAEMQQLEQPDRYYSNQFHPGPARIALEFEPDDNSSPVSIMVERTRNGARKVTGQNTSNITRFLESIQAESVLMDHRTFLKFIMDTPLERGRALTRLLGLEKVGGVRTHLSSLSDTRAMGNDLSVNALSLQLRTSQAGRRNAVAAALSQLGDIRQHTVTTDTFDLHQVANLCLEKLNEDPVIQPLIAGKRLSAIDYKACLERLHESDRSGDRSRLTLLQQKRVNLVTSLDLQGLTAQLDRLLDKVRTRKVLVDKSKGEAFKALYQAAKKVVETGRSTDECPLCERPWGHKSGRDLPGFVANQLSGYREILELEEDLKISWKALVQDSSVAKLMSELEIRANEAAPAAFGQVDVPTEQDLAGLRTALLDLEELRLKALAAVENDIASVQATLPPSLGRSIQAVTAAKSLTESLRAYLEATKDEASAQEELAAIKQWETFINKAAADFAQAETCLVQATIELLDEDIRTLYTAIMPGAPVLPKLSRQDGSERLFLMLEQFFGATDTHAVPLLSESYRNALGLAVFLAASRKRDYGGRFLILDDVTSSFDAGHQTYLLEAIYKYVARPEEPSGLQVIVLSHDGTLKKYFDTIASSGRAWVHFRLQGTAPLGPVSVTPIKVDHLRNNILQPLSTGDLDSARRAVRPYLESCLLQIIDQVHIRVPLDLATVDHKRMLGDMLNAIKWEIGIRERASDLGLDSTAMRDMRQNVIPFLQANGWAHYATDSTTSVDANAIRAVVDGIDRLVDAFKYTCHCSTTITVRKFFRSLGGDKQRDCGPNCG